ncbi:MAG: saccharopine dehydrogenase NADP-binding domain-containing protein [Chitinophagaceae bacterium]|nr:saccharopine dehydrogenase NADP-binding domain-containing protein [Chitinophagaceae bacterium]
MKKILLLGAGKSATVLIAYLKKKCLAFGWHLTVADNNLKLVEDKLAGALNTSAVSIDIHNEEQRKTLIEQADIVISMLPAALHFLVAQTCIETGRHLLTASYVDKNIQASASVIKEKGLLFLCEMGLDPGIDHMSAMQLINRIKNNGGNMQSFYSHCGGLVAPESDNNPWHYKISWNPKNIILAGKAGAVFKKNGKTVAVPYELLFDETRTVNIPGYGKYAWYPNRDSLSYSELYGLQDCDTFIRTTLRHPDFCYGWKQVVALKLTDEDKRYDTDGLSYKAFFQQHLSQHGLADDSSAQQKEMLAYLKIYNDDIIGKGLLTAAEILQLCAEEKLMLHEKDRDMIIMLHEIAYEEDKAHKKITSSLIVKGDNNLETAMAKTVGLPLGIAAVMILKDEIKLTGLHIPIVPEIYEPVLRELEKEGIAFKEEETVLKNKRTC